MAGGVAAVLQPYAPEPLPRKDGKQTFFPHALSRTPNDSSLKLERTQEAEELERYSRQLETEAAEHIARLKCLLIPLRTALYKYGGSQGTAPDFSADAVLMLTGDAVCSSFGTDADRLSLARLVSRL